MTDRSFPSSLLGPFAQESTSTCGDGLVAGVLCEWLVEATGIEGLAAVTVVLATTWRVLAAIIGAFVVSRLLRRWISAFAARMEKRIEQRLQDAQQRGAITAARRYRTRRMQRVQAIVGVMRGIVATTVWIIAVLIILNELGVRLQPILAGAGLIGVVVGFGAQQLVRDVLAGIAMLVEDQYGVGDWIEVDGKFGEVERVGLRSTAFRDLDGVVHHVLNGSMSRVGNLSQHWARSTFDVPLALHADIPAAKALIYKVAAELADDPVWGPDIIGPPEVWGVQELGPEGIKIRLVVPTKPLRNWDITRQLRERLKFAFDHAGITMPSQLIAIAGQEHGKPIQTEALGPLVGSPSASPSPRPVDEDTSAPTDPDQLDVTDQLRMERGPQPRPD